MTSIEGQVVGDVPMRQSGYRVIAEILRAAISRGDHPPGALLPVQADLARIYDVNIGTIRRAVGLLHSEGLVDPVQGSGTRVRERQLIELPSTRYSAATATAGPWEVACADQGAEGVTDVVGVSLRHADRRIATALDIDLGGEVVHRANRMRADGCVRQLQDTWIPMWLARGTPLAEPGKVVGGIYGGLTAAGHRPATATEVVIGRMPTSSEREHLTLRLGSPVLDSRRTTRDTGGRVIVYTQVVVAADHVCLVYPQVL